MGLITSSPGLISTPDLQQNYLRQDALFCLPVVGGMALGIIKAVEEVEDTLADEDLRNLVFKVWKSKFSAFLWDMNKTKWCNGFYIEFRQNFAKETFSYDEHLKSYDI